MYFHILLTLILNDVDDNNGHADGGNVYYPGGILYIPPRALFVRWQAIWMENLSWSWYSPSLLLSISHLPTPPPPPHLPNAHYHHYRRTALRAFSHIYFCLKYAKVQNTVYRPTNRPPPSPLRPSDRPTDQVDRSHSMVWGIDECLFLPTLFVVWGFIRCVVDRRLSEKPLCVDIATCVVSSWKRHFSPDCYMEWNRTRIDASSSAAVAKYISTQTHTHTKHRHWLHIIFGIAATCTDTFSIRLTCIVQVFICRQRGKEHNIKIAKWTYTTTSVPIEPSSQPSIHLSCCYYRYNILYLRCVCVWVADKHKVIQRSCVSASFATKTSAHTHTKKWLKFVFAMAVI